MNWARLYFGLLIVAVGVVLLLDNAGTLDAGDVLGTWWPAAIIGAGLIGFLSNPRHWPIPAMLILGGTALLLSTTDVIDLWDIALPALVILAGLFVIFGFGFGKRSDTDDSRISSFTMFSGAEIASHSNSFESGNIGAMFGGAEIDLRDSTPAPGASMDVFVAFGGVEIKVPQGWRVDMRGMPLFGGFENVTAKEPVEANAPALAVHATALFGGVEVSH